MVLGKMSGNHLSQPHNVPDLLLLQLYVGVKHSHLVALVESQCVAVSLLVVHDVVQRFLIHRHCKHKELFLKFCAFTFSVLFFKVHKSIVLMSKVNP